MVNVQWYGLYIKIDGNTLMSDDEARNYQAEVWNVLNKIEKVSSGRKLWQLLNSNKKGKAVTVVPSFDPFLQDTAAKPDSWQKALAPGQKANGATGAGGGSDVKIPFTPRSFAGMDRMLGYDTAADFMQADDVLFHELFHTLRMFDGVFLGNPMADGFEFEEEFFGILATNIYVQQQGRPEAIRKDHSLIFHPLEKAGQDEFYVKYYFTIDKLCQQMQEYTRELQKVDCKFNPIKRYWDAEDFRAKVNALPPSSIFDMLSAPPKL